MKKLLCCFMALVICLTLPVSAFATDFVSTATVSDQSFDAYLLSGNSDVYVDLEDPADLIGELDEDASCMITIELGSAGSAQPRDLHIPNIITVKLTPGKKGFAVFVINTGLDALTSLHLNLRLTDYNNNYIDSYSINDVNIPVGERSYIWMKDKSATIKENISLSGYAIDGPTYTLGPISTYRYNFAGGSYSSLSPYEGHRHHIPSNDVNRLPTTGGPCIRMLTEDHYMTSSYGSSASAQQYRAKEEALIKEGKFAEAMQMGIDDIRSLFGTKYNDAIAEMISYAVSKGYITSGAVH